jgi:alanyl-tRNA synthetase
LRFDFTHGTKLSTEQIRGIEDFVNERIFAARPVSKRELAIDEAKKTGAVMLFGEKYGDRVRVLGAADSLELCGGTHVGNTGNIGGFKIVSEASTAAGIRRIEAVCGPLVVEELRARENALEEIAKELKSPASSILDRIRQLKSELKQAKESKSKAAGLDRKEALSRIRAALAPLPDGVGASVVLPGFPAADLRALVDDVKKDNPNVVLALWVPDESQVSFVVAAQGAPAKRVKAGEVAKAMGARIGGGGGGRPDFAQGQGKNPAGTEAAAGEALALFQSVNT